MNNLTLEQLLQLHVLVMDRTGGSMGIRDLGRLEAGLATQSQNVFGEKLYNDATEKAAALIRGIIADHPFVDGNKRTAMLAGLTFLKMNGTAFHITHGDLEDFAVKIAVNRLGVKPIAQWLSQQIT